MLSESFLLIAPFAIACCRDGTIARCSAAVVEGAAGVLSVPKDARELEAEEGRLILAARERMERARVELISAQAFLFDAIERRQERQALSEWP